MSLRRDLATLIDIGDAAAGRRADRSRGQYRDVATARQLVVIEGVRGAVSARLEATLADRQLEGWRIVRGWAAPMRRDRVVCTGWIRSADDARRALLAAVAGAGLAVAIAVGRETTDRFLDDLRRLGPVDHQQLDTPAVIALSAEQRALLGLLAEGLTIGDAASELGMPIRTAHRRLAAARAALGAASTAAAAASALAPRRWAKDV